MSFGWSSGETKELANVSGFLNLNCYTHEHLKQIDVTWLHLVAGPMTQNNPLVLIRRDSKKSTREPMWLMHAPFLSCHESFQELISYIFPTEFSYRTPILWNTYFLGFSYEPNTRKGKIP